MTLDELKKTKVGQLAINAHLGGVEKQKPKPVLRGESENQELEIRSDSMERRITIISCRRKVLDTHDNLPFSFKPLVDAITDTLGFSSDSDSRLKWEYGQIETRGSEGTIVRIEVL